jgi:hypothetical protein
MGFGQKCSRGEGLDTSFREHYVSMSDDELLHIAGDRRDLREDAVLALDAEMARRGLTHQHARAKKRDELLMEIQEARAHHPKRSKSKYFVAQIDLPAYFMGLAGLVILMVLMHHYRIRDEWEWPLVVVYLGALIACLAVQPWVRRTLSFWFSLAISFVPQFVVAHWLAVYHPTHSNSGLKGSGVLSMLAGYALGGSVFVLLQKLKPGQGIRDTQ